MNDLKKDGHTRFCSLFFYYLLLFIYFINVFISYQ